MICSTCNGMRFTTRRVPEYRTATFNRTPDGYVCWPAQGGTPVRERFATGRTVTHTEQCATCNGSGIGLDPAHDPDCRQCGGMGERNAWDCSGEYVSEDCQCHAPAAESEAA